MRVAIKAAGLCHSDLSVIDGTIPYPTPVVLGHEGAGVDRRGRRRRPLGEGGRHGHRLDPVALRPLQQVRRRASDRVPQRAEPEGRASRSPSAAQPAFQFANASVFAEHTVVREQGAIPIDPRVPFDRAALIGCGVMTGFGAVVNRAQVETGATMAVFGVGGIGLNCVQGGVLAGAAKIIAVDVMPQKLEWAQRFGATHVDRQLEERPGGGDQGPHRRRRRLHLRVRRQHRGHQAGARRARAGRHADHRRRAEGRHRRTSSSSTRSTRTSRSSAAATARRARSATFPMLADLYLSGRLKIDELITRHYALDEFDTALDDLRARPPGARRLRRLG